MGNITIRPATAQNVRDVYGELPCTMRAYAAIYEDKCIAVAGVYYKAEQVVAFSKILPEYAHLKTGLARGALKVIELLKSIDRPVLAIAEPDIPTAPDLLERCGFKYMMTNGQGKVFLWQSH